MLTCTNSCNDNNGRHPGRTLAVQPVEHGWRVSPNEAIFLYFREVITQSRMNYLFSSYRGPTSDLGVRIQWWPALAKFLLVNLRFWQMGKCGVRGGVRKPGLEVWTHKQLWSCRALGRFLTVILRLSFLKQGFDCRPLPLGRLQGPRKQWDVYFFSVLFCF